MRLHLLGLVVLLGVTVGGCQQAVLNAPPTATLLLSASPTVIPEFGGQSRIEALVRLDSGEFAPDGVIVNFFTTLGTIDAQAKTRSGVATVTLKSGGTTGVATVSALSGSAPLVTLSVSIGAVADQVLISFDPPILPEGGGTAAVNVRLLDSAGGPIVGREVRLQVATPATLATGGSPLTTDATGRVRDSLTTTTSATVIVTVGTATTEATIRISTTTATAIVLTALPASLPAGGGSVTIRAFATDAGASPVSGEEVTFTAVYGTVSPATAITSSDGIATTTLTTTRTDTVTGRIGTVAGTAAVTVAGIGGGALRIQLAAGRNSVTNRGNPGIAACAPPGNPQLPLIVEVRVTDTAGRPVDGVRVTLGIEDLGGDDDDGRGGWCTGAVTVTAECCAGLPACGVPTPTPTPTPSPLPAATPTPAIVCCSRPVAETLPRSVVVVSGTDGSGLALATFTFDQVDFCECDYAYGTRRCRASIVAFATGAVQANDLVLLLSL